MHDFIRKTGLTILIVLVYFFGIRELRQGLHNYYLGTLFPEVSGQINENYSFISPTSVSFLILKTNQDEFNGSKFNMPFGSFWLYASIVLIVIGGTKNEYLNLIYIHLAAGVITFLLVYFGLYGIDLFLIATDFICRYLVPLFSLGYVAIVFGNRKSKLVIDAKSS